MSIHFHPTDPIIEDDHDANLPSSDEDEDETWDDWISDSSTQRGDCRSLFDNKTGNVEDIIAYDKAAHGFDLNEACARLCSFFLLNLGIVRGSYNSSALDVHGRIRLINFIRQTVHDL